MLADLETKSGFNPNACNFYPAALDGCYVILIYHRLVTVSI